MRKVMVLLVLLVPVLAHADLDRGDQAELQRFETEYARVQKMLAFDATNDNLLSPLEQSTYRRSAQGMRQMLDSIRAQSDPAVVDARARLDAFLPLVADKTAAAKQRKEAREAARAQKRAQRDAAEKLRNDFMAKARGPIDVTTATSLLRLEQDPKSGATPASLKALRLMVVSLERTDAACTGAYKGVTTRPGYLAGTDPITNDIDLWCKAAADRKRLLRLAVRNEMAQDSGVARWYQQQTRDLEKNEGWLQLETAWENQAVFDMPALQAWLVQKAKPWYDAIGEPVDTTAFADIGRLHDALWAEIDRLAPTWSFPPIAGHHACESKAKRAIAAAYHGAHILKSGVQDREYQLNVQEDGTGSRYIHGWVLFQVKGEPHCRLRAFTYDEPYIGHGKFQRASSVQLGFTRIQRCK